MPPKTDPPGEQPAGQGGPSTQPKPGTVVPRVLPDIPTPHRIGHYDIRGVVGQGGYGTVYHGVHRWLRVPGAIKVMRHVLSTERRPDFLREARRLARLRGHQAIAEVRDFGFYLDPQSKTRLPYFVMDLVPGGKTIADYADANNLDQTARLRLFARVCDGVRHAHDLDLVHLDLKPANILVWPPARSREAEPKIIDFGIARAADPGREIATHRGISGTIPYMSPEQTDPTSVLDKRSDIYSLGVVLYELLCRHLPIDVRGRTSEQAINAIRYDPPDFDSAGPRALPRSIRAVLQKALSKSPGDRQQDAGELLRDVNACLRGEAPPGSAPGPAVRAAYALRTLVRRRPVYTMLAVLVLAMAATRWIAVPLLYDTGEPSATGWFMARFSRAPFSAFEHVVLVARTQETDDLVQPPADPPSAFREHYATLLDRLADARPKAVVFDILFQGPGKFDEALADAARKIRARGVPVIVGVRSETLDEDGHPPPTSLSPVIRTAVSRWGDVRIDGNPVWWVKLVTQGENPDSIESLTLATVAALEARRAQPEAPDSNLRPRFRVAEDEDRVLIDFYREGEGLAAVRQAVPGIRPLSLRVTGVQRERSNPPRIGPDGRPAHDTVALLAVRPPALSAYKAASIGMERLLGEHPDETALQACTAKIVIVHHPAKDETLPHSTELHTGAHGHAAAIETLLRGDILRMPTRLGEWAILAFGAALGLALPLPIARRRSWWPRWAVWGTAGAWAVTIAAVLVAGVAGALLFNYIVNPLVVIFAMVVASGLSLLAARIGRFQSQTVEA